MEDKQMKCIKGKSCLYCGTNYCRFVDELYQLKQTLTEIKEICRFNFTITTTNILAKTILQKISECEVENEN